MAAPEMTAGKIGFVKKYSDVMIAVGIVTIVVMMIIPLPTILLDLLLCMNITEGTNNLSCIALQKNK